MGFLKHTFLPAYLPLVMIATRLDLRNFIVGVDVSCSRFEMFVGFATMVVDGMRTFA